MQDFITNFGLLFLVIVAFSLVTKLFRQPIILGYVLSGVLFSFFAFTAGFDTEIIAVFGTLGITFLLFLIGLEFDLKGIVHFGKDVLLSTLLQAVVFFIFAYLLTLFFPFTVFERVYLSVLASLGASTLLVGKWLEDKKETSTLHGKIILGTLIVQDILAIIAITLLSLLSKPTFHQIILAPVLGALLIVIAIVMSRYLLNRILKFSSHYPELLFVVSIGVCFFFVTIAPFFGYSGTIGAFIGGVVIANTIYGHDISARLRPLVTFFNMLFFVGLGFQLDFGMQAQFFVFAALFILLFFIVKPVTIYLVLRWRGYDAKTAFIPGLYMTQFSEFGIVMFAAAGSLIGADLSTIAIVTILSTMIVSSYFIKYAEEIYVFSLPVLRYTDRWFVRPVKDDLASLSSYDVLFFGYHQLSQDLFKKFESAGRKILVIDNNPDNISLLKKQQIPHVFNAVSNFSFFERLDFSAVSLVVSSLQDAQENERIIMSLKKANPSAVAIMNAKSLKGALKLYDLGADYVIYPTLINEQYVSVLLEDYSTDIGKVVAKKALDIVSLKEKQALLDTDRSSTLSIDDFVRSLELKTFKRFDLSTFLFRK